MNRHLLAILVVVVVVLSAGCASVISGGDSPPSTDTPDPKTTPTNDSEQSDASTPEANQTSTTYSEWSQPKPPNRHLENKIESGRIPDVQFVNTEPGPNGEGYADFDLEVTADTRMENVDPPEHGDVEGEPYFIVYVDEKRFARMDALPMRENGMFTIQMNKRGLEQFEPGQLDIKVRLFDEDSQWDDIYGVWTGTVEYNPQ